MALTKEDIVKILDDNNIKYEIVEYLFPFLTRRGSGGLINVI